MYMYVCAGLYSDIGDSWGCGFVGVVTPPTHLIGGLVQDWVEVVVRGEDHNGDLNTCILCLGLSVVSGNHG